MRYFNYKSDAFSISHNTSNRSLPFVPHTHQSWEMLFVKSGDLDYIVGNNIYRVTKNALLITRPNILHSITFNTVEAYERYRIYFDNAAVMEGLLAQIPEDLEIVDFNGNALVNGLFEKMRFYADAFKPETAQLLLQNTLQELICNIIHAGQSLKQIVAATKQPTVVRATEYISAHITEKLNIDDVATELFITRSHLYHLFVKHLNTTPKKYILQKKLLLAQRDLRMGYKPIEVCTRCGFSDYSTFYRDYKEHFGYAPSKEKSVPLYRSVNE